jgi:hypothetical protein
MRNEVIICGRIATAAIIKRSKSGSKYATFELHITGKKSIFIPIKVWEELFPYLNKARVGAKLEIRGYINTFFSRGVKKMEVVAEEIEVKQLLQEFDIDTSDIEIE